MPALARCTALALALAATRAAGAGRSGGQATALDASFDFGEVAQGGMVEHAFAIGNVGATPLKIERVVLTPPLVVSRMPAFVAPRGRGLVAVRLPTASLEGPFRGEIVVATSDPRARELDLTLTGRVVAPVEVAPWRAIFVAGTRAAPGTASVEIVSHEREPMRLDAVDAPSDVLAVRLDRLEKGRRWRLTVSLLPGGPAGRHDDRIVVHTTSRTTPTVTLLAHSILRERVYTFPDAVDLGTIPLASLRADPSLAGRLAQTVMVYQVGGTDFRARVAADLPFLRLQSERGRWADRYETTVAVVPEGLAPGPVRGSISVETNDPEFPRLAVPVTGTIVDR